MGNNWLDFSSGNYCAIDAAGTIIANVETARRIERGIEAIVVVVDIENNEHVCSIDGGITFESVRVKMQIPGGEIFNIEEDI